MQSTCNDIRITDQGGNLLPYWIEEGSGACNTATTKIWIKVPTVPTTDSTLLLYYGNPSAASYSNGTKVFPFFDDFNSGTLNSNKWGTTGSYSLSSGAVTVTTGSLYSKSTVANSAQNYIYESRQSWTVGSVAGLSIAEAQGIQSSNGGGQKNMLYLRNGANANAWASDNGVAGYNVTSGSLQFAVTDNTNYIFSFSMDGTNMRYYKDRTVTNTYVGTWSQAPYLYLGYYRGGQSGGSNGNDVTADWVLARKFATTEPTVTLGSEELGNGPVAYWKFDEGSGTTTSDSTSNANNGTINGATWKSKDQCMNGRCLQFDGTNDYVDVGDTVNFKGMDPYTIQAWVKTITFETSQYRRILSKHGTVSSQREGWLLWTHLNGSTRQIGCERFANGAGDGGAYVTNNELVLSGQWMHVVCTFDGTNARLYVNGKLVGTSGAATHGLNDTSVSLAIGRDGGGGGYFDGLIDDAKIYPYARTQEQIYSDYNKGAAAVLGAKDSNLNNGLVGYWKMDEDSTATASAQDASGNSNTGTATGTIATTGKFGNGREFNGTSDEIGVGSLITSTAYTKSAWINLSSTATQNNIISGDGTTMTAFWAPASYGGKLASGHNGSWDQVIDSTPLTTNTWYFVSVTYDPSREGGTLTLYKNGSQVSQATNISPPTNSGGETYIGAYSAANNFSGDIDEARIYTRALSPSEVTQLYNYAPPPVVYYDFENSTTTTLYDRSGNGHNGTWNGTGSRYDTGKYGKAGRFNGVDDWVNVGALGVTDDSTVEAWVYAEDTGTTGTYGIMGNSQAKRLTWSGTTFQYFINNSSWSPTYRYVNQSGTSQKNRWYHVAGVRDSQAGTIKIYIDGVLSNTTTGTPTDSVNDLGWTIVKRDSNTGFKGKIDEIKVYNYPRTTGQIIEDMNAAHPIGGSPVGSQIGYWKFDEGTGSTINNSGNSGSTYNGTISGASWSSSGKLNKALSFTGTNSVSIPDGADAFDFGTGDFTISTWIKTSTVANNGNLIRKGAGNGLSGWRFGLANGIPSMLIGDSAGYSAGNLGSTSIADDQWHQVTIVYDRDANAIGYIDGNRVGTRDISTRTGSVDNTATIGIGNTYDTFTGSIDELKIYNTALTDDQIRIDYNSGKSIQFGALGTDASGNPSNSSDRAYCPPGDTTASCGPIGEWKFDEMYGTTAKDTSGNGNNGTLTNGPSWYPNGKMGAALDFDGTDDYVDIPDNSILEGLPAATFLAWISPSIISGSSDIVQKESTYNFRLTSSEIQCWIHNGTGYIKIATASSSTISTNTWSNVACTWVAGEGGKIYVNGSDVTSSTTVAASMTTTTNPIRIGSRMTTEYFSGKIDQIQIFNYALSPSQIAWNMNRGKPVAHYRLNECQGTTINSSISRITGTLTIGATGSQTSAGTCQTAGTAWGDGASGKYGGSLNFDGTDDYINVNNDNALNTTSQVSISTWIKPQTQAYQYAALVQKGAHNAGYYLRTYNNTNLSFNVAGTWNACVTTSSPMIVGDWNHVTAIYDGTNCYIYVNGKQILSNTKTGSISPGSGSMQIAKRNSGENPSMNDEHFNGQIDDVQIFNYALTSQQVKTLYNNGAIYFGP